MRSSSLSSSFLITILVIFGHLKCEARDSINMSIQLSDNDTLVSAGKRFELGFFTPEGGERSERHVGIWYRELTPRTVVWVANRDKPLGDCLGFFGIAEDGNVKAWCSNGEPVPITSLESAKTPNRTLQLLDTGNLILLDGRLGTRFWQSFDNPTDTFLPGMKMSENLVLTSWISPSQPGGGNYTFRRHQRLYIIRKRLAVHWKSGEPGGPFNGNGLPSSVNKMLSVSHTGLDQKNYKSFPNYRGPSNNRSSRIVMNSSGEVQYYSLAEDGNWTLVWSEPENFCSEYNACGKFGICNLKNETKCHCPGGFKPVSSENWLAGKFSEGCEREPTKCTERTSFLNVSLMKVGTQVTPYDQAQTEEECKTECLNGCECEAYFYRNLSLSDRDTGKAATKCWIWTSELVDLHEDDADGSLNISLRTSSSTTALGNSGNDSKTRKKKSQKRYVIFFTVLVAGVILVSCFSYVLYRRRRATEIPGRQGSTEANPALFAYESARQVNDLMHENDKRIDVPFYSLDAILSATDNFSNANKLGQGGFGPVYKGKFPGGHEIAVKRLSSCSGQGIEEFLNEVVLIAKLQHRNLVRLLGYCIKGNERILLYEYMPNRSLDAFIFDQHNCLLLDWKKRFDIILGIARGLLYLHQDSRLRIIHRDLKTSNILLDEDMNPKISDFGLARILEGKGTEASTNRVVGTYGYMSPEYALEGKFSIKSDVFSFGVVVLEIIGGKKTTGFYNPREVLNLLGYAWKLWSDNKALDLVDPTLLESCDKSQVIKCVNIGLLCVQEDPNDRPSMSTVVMMLGSETTPLPLPSQPAFVVRRRLSATSSSSSTKPDTISKNELTISMTGR